MKNITFSADERLIEEARARAREQHTTLNEAFRQWLADYSGRAERARRASDTIRHLQGYVRTGGRKFTREEMNERPSLRAREEEMVRRQQAAATEAAGEALRTLEELHGAANSYGHKFTRDEMNER